MMPLRAILWNGWYIDAAFAGAIVLLTIGVYFAAVSPLDQEPPPVPSLQ